MKKKKIILSFILFASLLMADEPKSPQAARTGDPFGAFGSMGPPIPMISYEGRYSPEDNKAPSFTENKLNLGAPVYKTEVDTWALSLNNSHFHLGEAVVLDSGKKVPPDLYRVETAAQFFKQMPEKKSFGVKASIGYAGDELSLKSNDLTYNFSGTYGFPGSGKGHWMLMLFFSNNSTLGNYVPFPGISYLYRSETFTAMLGFPIFALRWTPVAPWSFSLGFYAFNIRSEVAYGSTDRVQFFSGYYSIRQNYIPHEREHERNRLTIQEKKTALGLRKLFWGSPLGELQFGQAFDRSIYIGRGHSDSKKIGGNLSIGKEWYASLALKMKF